MIQKENDGFIQTEETTALPLSLDQCAALRKKVDGIRRRESAQCKNQIGLARKRCFLDLQDKLKHTLWTPPPKHQRAKLSGDLTAEQVACFSDPHCSNRCFHTLTCRPTMPRALQEKVETLFSA